jgi:glycosyltransferase involved in cell wall biosynthesis
VRVLYFSRDYTPHDHRFLAALAGSGHAVFYVRLERGPHQTEDRPVPANIEQVQWAGGMSPFRWRDVPRLVVSLRRVIKRLQPDLLHAGPIQTCAFIAVLTGFRPILTMSWGFDLMKDDIRNAWWQWVTRYTLRRSTYFTSDAEVTREKAVAYGMNAQRTVVFPWGVDLEHFSPLADDRQPDEGFTLFCNRSWEPNYGVDVVARAFVKAAAQRDDISLMLLGGGSQGTVIRDILMGSGVMDRVTFPGHISQADLPRYYRLADLFISASHVDGSSVSLMEALACGLPCVVSDIPANKEWVADGVNGWIFPDGDVDALAGIILKAVEQRESLARIGGNARATAGTKADWTRNFEKLLEAYQQTCKLAKVNQVER